MENGIAESRAYERYVVYTMFSAAVLRLSQRCYCIQLQGWLLPFRKLGLALYNMGKLQSPLEMLTLVKSDAKPFLNLAYTYGCPDTWGKFQMNVLYIQIQVNTYV